MDTDVIKSYLVALGWQIDTNQMAQFEQTLAKVQREVEHHTVGLGNMFVKLTGSIVGAYAAIATATVGLANSVSQGELDFQLYAMQMYMSVDAAKKMKIASEALGYSLDQIAWNPELRERFRELIQEQALLQKQLGGDYQRQMRNLRDIRFEFTKLGVAFQYLGQSVVVSLARAFGLDSQEGVKRLDEYLNNFIARIPEISRGIATDLVPALKEAWQIAKDLGAAAREVATGLVHMVSELTGDKALAGPLTFEKLLKAIDDVDAAIKTTWADIKLLFQGLDKFGDALDAARHGEFKKAGDLFRQGVDQLAGVRSPAPGATGALGVTREDKQIVDWAKWFLFNRYGETPMPQETIGGPPTLPPAPPAPGVPAGAMAQSLAETRDRVVRAIISTAQNLGISPGLALGIAKQESDFNPNAVGTSGEKGVMQLMPDTALREGVKDPFNYEQNIAGGLRYYQQLLRQFKDETLALEAYNWGPDKLARALATGGAIPASVQKYARDVEERELNVGGVTINITQPGASKEEIETVVLHAIEDALVKKTQRTLSQATGVYR